MSKSEKSKERGAFGRLVDAGLAVGAIAVGGAIAVEAF